MLNSNFKHYDNHEFHKLKQKYSNNKNFSLETLESLINNLNHDFDVIALSETWTSENHNL